MGSTHCTSHWIYRWNRKRYQVFNPLPQRSITRRSSHLPFRCRQFNESSFPVPLPRPPRPSAKPIFTGGWNQDGTDPSSQTRRYPEKSVEIDLCALKRTSKGRYHLESFRTVLTGDSTLETGRIRSQNRSCLLLFYVAWTNEVVSLFQS